MAALTYAGLWGGGAGSDKLEGGHGWSTVSRLLGPLPLESKWDSL